ncbi:sialic acid-binding Ig-like lectin 10 isoform X1 [Cynocephalus volans]|uniref:sialic acid-binding Ig-like lectin 10 isoform X1 n=1 Tax=Cynocephalus volans TaxID=110931 RepID=UPI002FCAD7EF
MLLPLLLSLLWGGEWAEGEKRSRLGLRDTKWWQAQDPAFQLEVPELVTVQEGLCVLVPCTVTYPKIEWDDSTSAYGYWFRKGTKKTTADPVATNEPNTKVQMSTQDRFQLVGNPHNYSCSLVIRDARKEDMAAYYFRVERGPYVKYNFNSFFLNVTALTQRPDVYLPETLEPEQPVTVICVFNWAYEGCPAATFSWKGAVLSSQETKPTTSYFSVLSITPSPQDHDTNLTCQVDFSRKGVSTHRTVQLSIAYAPKDLVLSVSRDNTSALQLQENVLSLEAQKGQFLRLLCAADGQPPAMLSWVLDDRVLSRSSPSGPRTLELELPGVKAGDSGRYTCRAENRLGFQRRSLDLSVQYLPENLKVMVSQANRTVLANLSNGTSLPVLEGQSLRLVCVTCSNPPARLSWAWRRQTLSPTQPSDPGVLELPRIQMEHEGEFTCQAQNPLGSQHISLSLSVHYPPQLLGPSCSWEAEGLHCGCSSRAQPAPSLRWWLGEGLLEGNSSNSSFTVTSSSAGPWANSSLSLHGGFSSGLRLSCEAENIHGTHSIIVLLLPDKKGSISTAFSKGVFLGTGITTLLSLCLILITVNTLRKKWTQAETLRPRVSRSSTILDYINVIPNTGPLARNRRAKPSSPSQSPSPGVHPPEPKKNQKELRFASPSGPRPKSSTQDPEYENSQEELHYATLKFLDLRPRLEDTQADYEEIEFH